ncbi:MAG: class I SAM-dependent methyltransferase [Candidatus Omnitrophica bacterium]|nr:class I SAM-dependent methyltransferase [Candidatus Omnitrophota bacterium]
MGNQNHSYYKVKYINCKVCGADDFKLLGIRGNLEYFGASTLKNERPHMITNVVRCKKCDFVYTNPYIITDEAIHFYNNPDTYFSSVSGNEEKLFKRTLSLLEKFSKKGRLLDIGSGKGEFLNLARDSGWEVYGIEMSEQLATYSENKYNLKIEKRPIEEIGYPDRFFNAVTLNMVLEHLEAPNNIIKEAYRILSDEGVILIEVPNMNSFLLKAIKLFFLIKGKAWSPFLSPLHKPYHSYGYSNSTLKFLLNSHNLKVIKIINGNLSNRGIEEKSSAPPLLRIVGLIITAVGAIFGMGDVTTIIAKKKK